MSAAIRTSARAMDGDVSIRRGGGEPELSDVKQSLWGPRGKLWGTRTVLLTVVLSLWEWISGNVIDEFWISKPSKIGASLQTWVTDARPGEPFWSATLPFHLTITIQEMVVGYFFGCLAGIIFGFILGQWPFFAKVIDPFVMAVYSLPKIALGPLFILWFGIGIMTKFVFVAVIVFFLVFWNTYVGIKEVDQDLIDVVRIMGGKKPTIIRKVILPSSAIWIFVGLKLALPYALVGAVVGELIASNRGIGFLLMRSSGYFDTHGLFATLFILMMLGAFLTDVLDRVEGSVMRWKVISR